MKKISLFVAAIITISFVQCKSKQKTVEGAPTPVSIDKADGTRKTAGEVQIEITQARWPGSTTEDLKTGQNIFTTKCTECHKAYDIPGFTEKKWLHEIDDMSPRAKLTAEEKLKLTKYVLSYRETKEKLKES